MPKHVLDVLGRAPPIERTLYRAFQAHEVRPAEAVEQALVLGVAVRSLIGLGVARTRREDIAERHHPFGNWCSVCMSEVVRQQARQDVTPPGLARLNSAYGGLEHPNIVRIVRGQ